MKGAVALLILLANSAANAAEVLATLEDGKLGVRVDGLVFPATLPKELTSGLTNRLYARVALNGAGAILGKRIVEYSIRYDLWDQTFSVISATDGSIAESRTLASLADVEALLASLPLSRLFEGSTLPVTDLTLRVEVLLNPIDREKMRMIRKWVAQNSTPEAAGGPGITVSNTIFNRIFEQYADGSDVAAAWRVTLESRPFRLDALKNEGR